MTDERDISERFLVLAPTGRDGTLTCALLHKAGLIAVECRAMKALCDETARGAAGLLIAEEALDAGASHQLIELLEAQPAWSDLAVLVFTGHAAIDGRERGPRLLSRLGNVTLLDRPLRPITLVSVARAALRSRLRQYEVREEIARREIAVKRRDQFLAMLGHELRNPLAVIVLATEMLARDREAVDRHGATIARHASHLTRLVDDLLDVSRVTSGKIVLKRQAVDLGSLARRGVEALSEAARQRELKISTTLDGTYLVDGDPVRLEQVLSNLLNNAIKYTPPGGTIRLSVADEDGTAVLRVIDDGAGIAPDMLPHVFDLFAQAQGTLDRAQGGLGIGLTMVRALVELHGGEVEAASAGVGCGSQFAVRLPLRAGAEDTPRRAVATVAAPGAVRRQVLIIEDNEDTRELLRELIETFGHVAHVAADGSQGVERALAMRPEVVLVDIGLPGVDGYTVARRVRAGLGKDVVMVAVTGYGQPEDRRRALEAGFDLHYTKPLDAARLAELLAAPGRIVV